MDYKQLGEIINEKALIYKAAEREEKYLPPASKKPAIIGLLYEYVQANPYFKQYANTQKRVCSCCGRIVFSYKSSCPACGCEDALSPPLEEYGEEIFITARDTIEHYDPDKGAFLPYFNKSMKTALNKASGKMKYEQQHQGTAGSYDDEEGKRERGGAYLSEKKISTLSKIDQSMKNKDENCEEEIIALAKELSGVNLTKEDIEIYYTSVSSIDHGKPRQSRISDDEQDDYYGIIEDDNVDRPLEGLIKEDNIKGFINYIEQCIGKSRTEPQILGDALTARCSEWIFDQNEEEIMPMLKDTSWYNPEIYEYYERTGERMKDARIAEMHDISRASLCRCVMRFIEKHLDEGVITKMLI